MMGQCLITRRGGMPELTVVGSHPSNSAIAYDLSDLSEGGERKIIGASGSAQYACMTGPSRMGSAVIMLNKTGGLSGGPTYRLRSDGLYLVRGTTSVKGTIGNTAFVILG